MNAVPFICRDMVFIQEHQKGRQSILHEDLDSIVLKVTKRHSVFSITFISNLMQKVWKFAKKHCYNI